MKKIAILGCGYVGSEAAILWKNQGHFVIGTTRNPERVQELAAYTQEVFLFNGDQKQELTSLISDNEILLVSVAADSSADYEKTYLKMAEMIREIALKMDVRRTLIYTSSTGVYGDAEGKWVDENSELRPDTVQGKILIKTEGVYQSLRDLGWDVCILRLAEIYGPHRELSERIRNFTSPLPGSGMPFTNMVHRTDCARAIVHAQQNNLTGIFNLADDDHPTRKELYETVAHKFELTQPIWDPSRASIYRGNKRVPNNKIKATGFVFTYPHRLLS